MYRVYIHMDLVKSGYFNSTNRHTNFMYLHRLLSQRRITWTWTRLNKLSKLNFLFWEKDNLSIEKSQKRLFNSNKVCLKENSVCYKLRYNKFSKAFLQQICLSV